MCNKLYKSYYFFVDFRVKSITFKEIYKKTSGQMRKKYAKSKKVIKINEKSNKKVIKKV